MMCISKLGAASWLRLERAGQRVMWLWTQVSIDYGSDGTLSGPVAFVHLDSNWTRAEGELYTFTPNTHDNQTTGPWAQMVNTFLLSLTYFGSFLQQSDYNRSVPATHCPIQRTHPAVVNMLNHGPMIHQELDLGKEQAELLTGTVDTACPFSNCLSEPGYRNNFRS